MDDGKSTKEYADKWNAKALELLKVIEPMDRRPMEKYLAENPPEVQTIAALAFVAIKEYKRVRAIENAKERHKEHYKIKEDLFAWLDANNVKFKSNEAAATAITKQQPISHITARDWYREWKSLQSARKPQSLPARRAVS